MKKPALVIIGCIIFLVSVAYYLLFTSASTKAHNVPITRGAATLNVESVSDGEGNGINFCAFAKKGCGQYVSISPTSKEFIALSPEQQECAVDGCVVWGIGPKTEATLTFTDEEATSLINDLKPSFLLVNDIRLKFEDNKIYAEGFSWFPIAPGYMTAMLEPVGTKGLRIVEVHIGRIPLPDSIRNTFERQLNTFSNYEWYTAKLRSLQINNGSITLNVSIVSEVLKHLKQ